MNIQSIYPSCPVPVVYSFLEPKGEVGNYDARSDTITLCESLKDGLPLSRSIIYLHEMFHATGHKHRSLRRARLVGAFSVNAWRVEECIAEIATMVALEKLGTLNKYSTIIPEAGITKHYKSDLYIPWKEVVSAVNCFKDDEVDFTVSLNYVKEYLLLKYKMTIREGYEGIRD